MTRLLAYLARRAVRIYLLDGRMLVAVEKFQLLKSGELELALIRHRPPR